MGIYEELQARGLIAQVTDEAEIRDVINNGKATFYIGFDCTADSLTAGHFMALTLMKRLQQAGNRPIALIGGGTTMIGDPSGRTDMRKMLTKEDIDHNAACFKRQMERFIDFGEGKALGRAGEPREPTERFSGRLFTFLHRARRFFSFSEKRKKRTGAQKAQKEKRPPLQRAEGETSRYHLWFAAFSQRRPPRAHLRPAR